MAMDTQQRAIDTHQVDMHTQQRAIDTNQVDMDSHQRVMDTRNMGIGTQYIGMDGHPRVMNTQHMPMDTHETFIMTDLVMPTGTCLPSLVELFPHQSPNDIHILCHSNCD